MVKPCRARSKLRREEVGGGLLRRWESLGPCRWQAAHPLQLVQLAIYRRRTPHRYSSLRRKSRTSAWRLSMSSTRKTLQHIVPAYSLPPEGAEAVQEAAAGAQCAEAAAGAAAAQSAAAEAAEEAAVSGLDPSGSASSSSSLRSRLRLRERQRSATRPGSDYIYFEEEPGRDERPPTCSHATKPGALRPISPSCRSCRRVR